MPKDGNSAPRRVLAFALPALRRLGHDAQAERERSENRLRTIVHKAAIPMSFGPLANGSRESNEARAAFHELTREQMATVDWRTLIHPDDLDEALRLHEALMRGDIDRYRMVQRCVMPDGRIKWGDVMAARHGIENEDSDFVIVQIVDMTPEVEARRNLQQLVDTDAITGLRSRAWITNTLQRALERAADSGVRVAAMFVDLSEFQFVNRALGFGAGDEVLAAVGRNVRAVLPDDYLLGRFDGHQFVIVVPEVRDASALLASAQAVLDAVAQDVVIGGGRVARTGSIGIALSKRHSTANSLLRDADRARTQAKALGRSRIHLLHEAPDTDLAASGMHLEHALREALDNHEFVTHYQPQVDLASGEVCGYEALVRWQHPQRGLLTPGNFMEHMEESGLVVALGRVVLDMVCKRIAATPAEPVPVSINVSAVELGDPAWFANFERTLDRFGVPGARLVVEITETTALALTRESRITLNGIRELGVGLHLDDFGTGYASIGVLRGIPLTAVKLDQSYVAPLDHPDGAALDLVRSIAGLANGLGLATVAEGIETELQAARLRECGWRFGQGFLFGRPAPFSA